MTTPIITLYRGFQKSKTFVTSPYVEKLELRLRHGNVQHTVDVGSPLSAPRGKVPYVALSRAGSMASKDGSPEMLGDSTLIINRLVRDGVLDELNAHLSPAEKAQDLAIRGLLEDKLYWYHYYEMWNQNYYIMRPWVLWTVPWPAQIIVGLLVWRTVQANLQGQGTGRFSIDEVRAFRREIWESMEALLVVSKKKNATAGKSFWVLGGEKPTEADMSLFGSIVAVLACPAAPEAIKVVKSLPTVMEYAYSIRDAYFPDYKIGL